MLIFYLLGLCMTTLTAIPTTSTPHSFTTQRTSVEKANDAHTPYLSQILHNQRVQDEYNTTDKQTFENAAAQMAIITTQWNQHGYGLYTIFDKESSAFLGFAGYHAVNIDELGTVDCFKNTQGAHALELYGLGMPDYWRKGYGFEVATKLVEIAALHLPHTDIIAYIEPKNSAALQLAKKLHFQEAGMVTYNDKPHVLYRLRLKQ